MNNNQNTYNQPPMGQGNHMKILEVSRYKNNFADHQLPFVTEQGEAIAQELRKSPIDA